MCRDTPRVPDEHRGLLGEPPSAVDVVVRTPPPGPLTERIVALRAHATLPRLLVLVPVVVVIAVAVAFATRGGGVSGMPGGAPVGGVVRCINASTLCMTRGALPRQTARGPN